MLDETRRPHANSAKKEGLAPFSSHGQAREVTPAQMDMTVDAMAHSLVYWTQEVVGRGVMRGGGRIYAMTSSGSTRVLPSYGPVSGMS